MRYVTIVVLQRHIDKAIKTCAVGGVGSSRQQNCALAEAINERLLPGMWSEVHHKDVGIFMPTEMLGLSFHVATVDLPPEATRMIDQFDEFMENDHWATQGFANHPKPMPGSFVLDMGE